MLKLGGYINILIAIGHIVGLFWADKIFEVTGIGIAGKFSNPSYNSTDTLAMFQMDKGNSDLGRPFTIYEGHWGKPYAARFELWFVSDNSGGQEKKLLEKNYKIEGWQR